MLNKAILFCIVLIDVLPKCRVRAVCVRVYVYVYAKSVNLYQTRSLFCKKYIVGLYLFDLIREAYMLD